MYNVLSQYHVSLMNIIINHFLLLQHAIIDSTVTVVVIEDWNAWEKLDGVAHIIEKTRSCGRPTKHDSPHESEDNALKVTQPLTTSTWLGLHPTCCIVVPHENINDHITQVSSCTRLEQRFVKQAGEVYAKICVSGRARQQMIEKCTTHTICKGEVEDFQKK